jgi:hypothetical protein
MNSTFFPSCFWMWRLNDSSWHLKWIKDSSFHNESSCVFILIFPILLIGIILRLRNLSLSQLSIDKNIRDMLLIFGNEEVAILLNNSLRFHILSNSNEFKSIESEILGTISKHSSYETPNSSKSIESGSLLITANQLFGVSSNLSNKCLAFGWSFGIICISFNITLGRFLIIKKSEFFEYEKLFLDLKRTLKLFALIQYLFVFKKE